MRAEVISIKNGKMKGKWDGIYFTYKGEVFQGREKDPTERFIFGNQPIAKVVQEFKPGDWVDLAFEKNGKFFDLVGAEKIAAPANPDATEKPASGHRQSSNYDETQRRISRSAALKEGVQIALSRTKATTKAEVIVEQAKEITRDLEKFLNFEEEEKEITDSVGEVKTEESFEQEPFDA